jgi:hypothetical protein
MKEDLDIIKKEYDSLISDESFLENFPQLKGEWSKDRVIFTKYYEENISILNDDIDIDDIEDDDYPFEEGL